MNYARFQIAAVAWSIVAAVTAVFVSSRFAAGESTTGAAAVWPSWRGARTDGVASQTSFPATWPAALPPPVWTAKVEEGWSSPIVADGRVFVTDRLGAEERTLAFDAATGKLLWKHASQVDFEPHAVGRRHGNGPKATPVYSDGRVYSVGIAGRLHCLDAKDGREIWKKNYPAEFAAPEDLPENQAVVNGETNVLVPIGPGRGGAVPLFGYTGSPIVVDDRLIAPVGGPRGGTIMAFDAATGAVVWKSLSENVSYSSPVPAEIAGVRQIVVPTGPRVVGLDLKDGRLLWSFDYQNSYDETIGTPVVAGDLVVLTAVGRPLTAHRIVAEDGTFRAVEAWQNDDLSSYLSSMLAVDGHVYGVNDDGRWHCIRLSDGRTIWRGEIHGYYCTPVAAERRILGLNERGELAVLNVDPTAYRLIATYRLTNEPTWTTPAVVGNRLYIRSRVALTCFEVR